MKKNTIFEKKLDDKSETSHLYKQSENVQELLDSLRDQFISFKEYSNRCHVELKTSGSENNLKYFYFPPKIPLLDEPEKQKQFRKKFIQEVSSIPEPEPLILIADNLHQNLVEIIGDRSNPNVTKSDLANFFKRRIVYLQHKKYKILHRWGNLILTSEYIDKTSIQLDSCLSRLQKELDQAFNRLDRLQTDDNYNPQQANRPHPTAKEQDQSTKPLYIESANLDDIEVYLRIQTYRNRIMRQARKLVSELKWLTYSSRFDVWGESRAMIVDYKYKYNEKKFKVFYEVARRIKNKLEMSGVNEEKVIQQITDKYTKHLKGDEFISRQEQLINSHICDHEQPPVIVSNNFELKLYLADLSREFGINGDLEIDNGHSFTYQVQVYYPTHFQKQLLFLQFDWYDTSAEVDQETIEKISKNLGLSKAQILNQMSRMSELERKKSLIGSVKTDNNIQFGPSLSSQKIQEEIKNLEEKAKKQNIDFFSLDETEYKLKKADWLEYVYFDINVPEHIKRQQHYLNQVNQYDSLLLSGLNFLDVNDAAAVNKILDESSATHMKRAQKRNLLRSEDLRFLTKEDEINQNLKSAIQKSQYMQEQERIAITPMIEPIPQHIIKAYYTLKLLKSRDFKIKLMHTLNYFRAIQKRLCLDISEFYAREKVLGDLEIIHPQFGKDSSGNSRSAQNGNTGPGGIFQGFIQRKLDEPEGDQNKSHPISIKGYKYNMEFNPQISSTCPCIPKYHSTFGRPRLFESLQQEQEKQINKNNCNREARRFIGKQDKIWIDQAQQDIIVFDEYGIKVVYQEALNDMLEIEEELLKIGTFFINKHEYVIDCDGINQQSSLDRNEMVLNLIQNEFHFQFNKALLVEQLIQCYEHTCDPLEQVRIIQIICDTMAQRVRLNLEATYFQDSYKNEIEVLKMKREFYMEVISYQIESEEKINKEVRQFQELKLRKIQDHIQEQWQYKDDQKRIEKMGSNEEEAKKAPVTEKLKDRLEQKGIVDPEKRQKLKEIAQRHITEYANNQYMDFSDVLGLPEVTAEQLFNKQGEKEPLLVDCLREHSNFSKVQEGYPWYFSQKSKKQDYFGNDASKIGIFDFYDSLCCITQINAGLQQSLEELIKIHTPENGMAISCLERALIIEAKGKIRILRSLDDDSNYQITKCKNKIEEEFYFSNSDKLIFLMKEFKYTLHPDIIEKKSNPLLVAKLDIKNMQEFDFPRIKIQDIKGIDDMTNEEILNKMIDMAKITITGETQEEKLIGGNLKIEDLLEKNTDLPKVEKVKSPSMLILSCNLLEIIRLREHLIQKIHETDLLSIIYKEQLKKVNKDNFKLILADQLAFDTSQILKDGLNLIDYNDGTKLNLDLPFREFDFTLRASMDFQSESCIKALMTDLGVEELRAILHYQIMQYQLLYIAVLTNQLLLDGSQQGLMELEFLTKKRSFTVPNTVINLNQILSKGTDGYNTEMLNKEKAKLKQISQREVGDYIYSIASKKAKQRQFVTKKFTNMYQKVITFTYKPEIKLRILRAYRIRLLHQYCKDVLREAYQDSMKIQILEVCNELRIKQQLLPKDSNLFNLGQGEILEKINFSFSNNSNFHKNNQKYNIGLLMNNRFETLFYIPSSDEIMQLESRMEEKELQQQNQAQFLETINEFQIDQTIKEQVKLINYKVSYKIEEGYKYPYRKTYFIENYSYNCNAYKVLNYMTLLHKIFYLEYLMGRNNSPGLDILEMEDKILTGRPYWEKTKDLLSIQQQESSGNLSTSERVINQIITQKKAKIDLAEDLLQISDRLHQLNNWSKKFTIENLKIETMIELLNLYHQKTFNHLLVSLELLTESYVDRKNDECYSKIQQVKQLLMKKDIGFNMSNNGFSFNQACITPLSMDTDQNTYNDYEDFLKCYRAILDEDDLIPQQIEIVRKNFGQNTFYDNKNPQMYNKMYFKNYAQMENCFLNVNDQERQYIYTNFYQLDDLLGDFLTVRGIGDADQADPEQVLIIKNEFLVNKIESNHMQDVFISWIGECSLPQNTSEYSALHKMYKDQLMMKILQERDLLNESMNKKQDLRSKLPDSYSTIKKDSLYESMGIFTQKEQHTLIKFNERKARSLVIKRDLDIRLIKLAIQMIRNEQSSLLSTFEAAATEKEINAFVHPQQQFAATLYQEIDRNSHLDIVNKLSFVQQFLTRLRNRCTEVETLTSGPGIVFSMKDFNECIQIFCRGLLKYGEQELRTRVETQYLRENQYKHLLYLKDQQTLYFKRKCEQFLTDIDKLINSKLTQKGNQIIYELDISNRELRMLKDNFYLMERLMRQEIKHEYERDIKDKENLIVKFKKMFGQYKVQLDNEIKDEVAKEIQSLDKRVKQIVDKRDTLLQNQFKSITQTLNTKQTFTNKNQLNSGENIGNSQLGQHSSSYYDVESRTEILSLHRFIRKYKVLTKMKEVISHEKHERELFNQRQQLTSNSCLWEQLAEAEKREQIMRQELYYTQQNLAQYEKLIEKLQAQLENLQNQKLRLQQYKNSKSKRIEELESKMRDVEILDNIDLNKVLEELRQRDKKLQQMQAADRNFSSKIDVMNKITSQKINEVNKKYNKEKEMKEQAFGKLENLRLEMRALEGRDYTSELWKDKCKELFEICKELQKENDEIKETNAIQNSQIQQQKQQMQQQSNNKGGGNQYQMSPNSTVKDKQAFSMNSILQTTKPSTAAAKFGAQSRLLSRGGIPSTSFNGIAINSNHNGIEQTLTSGLSLPEIIKQETDGTLDKQTNDPKGLLSTQGNSFGQNRARGQNLNVQTQDANVFTSVGSTNDIKHILGNKTGQEQMTTMTSDLLYGIPKGMQNQFSALSNQNNKTQVKGNAIIQSQSKYRQKQKRLKTTQGERRGVSVGTQNETQQQANQQQLNQQQLGFSLKEQQQQLRKSGNAAPYSRQQHHNITSQGFAGIQFINNNIGQSSSIASSNNNPTLTTYGQRMPVNLNINFNTTNINMNK